MMSATLSYKDVMSAKKSKAMNKGKRWSVASRRSNGAGKASKGRAPFYTDDMAVTSRRTQVAANKKKKTKNKKAILEDATMIKKKKERNTSKTKREHSFWYTDEIEMLLVCEFDDGIVLDDFYGYRSVIPRAVLSCGYSYNWWGENNRYMRRRGEESISFGVDEQFEDRDLLALSQLEAAISSGVRYQPCRVELQNRVNEAYELKEKLEIEEIFGDGIRFRTGYDGMDEDMDMDLYMMDWVLGIGVNMYMEGMLPGLTANEIKVKKSVEDAMEQCEAMIKSIKKTLDQYIKNEQQVRLGLPFLAISVYRYHLHQLAIEQGVSSLNEDVLDDGQDATAEFVQVLAKKERRANKVLAKEELAKNTPDLFIDAGWKQLKESVPARAVPAVGIIMQCVVPFLLGGGEEQNGVAAE